MRLGLGCVGLGSGGDHTVSDDIGLVHAAIDLGLTVFDTADVYGSGASEYVLGRALRSRRDEVTLATKGGFVARGRTPVEQWARRKAKGWKTVARAANSVAPSTTAGSRSYARQDFSPLYLRRAVHASLRRLRTDRIDVYQLHEPPEVIPHLFDQLSDLVVVGDVVQFGVGSGSLVLAEGWVDVPGLRVLQVPFGILDPETARLSELDGAAHGPELWVRGVLGGGLLGLADRDASAIAAHPKRAQVAEVRRIAREAGLDAYQLAFGFVRACAPTVSTVLFGASSRDHLRRNVAAASASPLSADVRQALCELPSVTAETT